MYRCRLCGAILSYRGLSMHFRMKHPEVWDMHGSVKAIVTYGYVEALNPEDANALSLILRLIDKEALVKAFAEAGARDPVQCYERVKLAVKELAVSLPAFIKWLEKQPDETAQTLRQILEKFIIR